MSRIAYVNGRYLPLAQASVQRRGPRLSVLRRRLRGLRGEGRPADRRAPPHGAARRARSPNCASRMPMSRGRARRRAARDGARATACATASSICRSRAAWRGAIMPFRRPARAPSLVVTARSIDLGAGREAWPPTASPSSRCRTTAGRASTSSRSSLLPNVLAKQAAREQGAREAWFVDADGRVTEGSSSQCLDRHARRQGGHPAGRPRHPARHHPHGGARRDRGAGARRSRSAPSRSRRPTRAREAFITSASQIVHAGGAASTAARSATARPA